MGSAPASIGVNTDITQAQVITKDEKVDMIDVNLQTDLANKEERDKIRDAKDRVGDVVETVKNAVQNFLGINPANVDKNFENNRFTTKGANAIEDNEELNKLQKELKTLGQKDGITEDEAKMIVLATVKEMYKANGFSDIPDIKFEDGISGEEESVGARGTETGTIYIDLKKLASEMNNPDAGTGTLVGLIAHETSHSEKYGETTGNLLIEEGFADSKENLAENKFKEDKEVLTPEERAKALADLKEKYAREKADSDSVTAKSEDEPIEGKALAFEDDNAKNGSKKKTTTKIKEIGKTGIKSFNDFADGLEAGLTYDLANKLFGQSPNVDDESLDFEFGHAIGSVVLFGYVFDGLLSFKGNKELKNSNPLENVKYTPKVENQMNKGDYHSFPKSVEAFGKDGKVTKIIGGDKVERTKVEIPGTYRNKEGVFEFIIEPDGTSNHRLFKELK